MKKRLAIYFVIFELVIIGTIITVVTRKLSTKISISPLNAKYLAFHPVDGLHYFYEPMPNMRQEFGKGFVQELGYPPGSQIVYSINNDGLNQKSNYSVKKPDKVYRIVTIGDSFTFGDNVSTGDNYPSQLEDILNKQCISKDVNKFQVINLGVPGYDIRYAVERYKIKGRKYDPNLILWFIIGDDFRRIDEEQIPKVSLLHKRIIDTQGQDAGLIDAIYHGAWKSAIKEVVHDFGGENNVLNLQKNYLLGLSSYFKKTLVTFAFPSTPKIDKQLLYSFSKSRPKTWFYANTVDIYRDSDYYLNDKHPSPDGYKIIVQDIFNYMLKNKIIPCKN